MRRQKDLLMTALRPFYFDPLVDWVTPTASSSCRRKGDTNTSGGEVENAKAVETLKAIEKRLDGQVEAKRKAAGKSSNISMPLSVAGQVNFLIKEATSVDNLSQMYLGWASYY